MTATLEAFATAVGPDGPVTCAGGRTQWEVGGPGDPAAREVRAPAGVRDYQPAEMIVRVGAGTTLAELDEATGRGGQFVALEADDADRATVGGVLACGRSGRRRLGWGPIRDTVLEVTAVDHRGRLVRAGAPLVKNVTGFDLCRLFVGSVGTLGLLAEVVLRCRPRPETERWFVADEADPFAVHDSLYRALSVLWDGNRTWVGLAGYGADVAAQATGVLGSRFEEIDGPPPAPGPVRAGVAPARLRDLPSGERWLAEVGVGVVHAHRELPAELRPAPPGAGLLALHRRLKANFDPGGRLNPGRTPLRP